MSAIRRFVFALLALLTVASSDGAQAGQVVTFSGYAAGSIVISTSQRQLYYVLGGGRAIRYPIGVGKAGMAWHGTAYVSLKKMNPAWQAPPSLNGGRYGPVIPGGSPSNPMGVAVLGLDRGAWRCLGWIAPITPSTAPTIRPRLVAMSRTAASACIIPTCSICMRVRESERR